MADISSFNDDELVAEIARQGDLIKGLKGKKTSKADLQPHVDRLVALKADMAKRLESKNAKGKFDRTVLEGLLLKRFFYSPSFAIYGGVAGLFDYGPPGTALMNNMISLWRRHFVLEEDILEIECTNLTPESVFKTSGHVERFADYMQVLKGRLDDDAELRAGTFDKKKVPKGKALPTQLTPEVKADYELILESRLEIKSPESGNDITEPKLFNLMFETQIGPTGQFKGATSLTSSGLLEFNADSMPFASASIGKSFRNEISPRQGLLRVSSIWNDFLINYLKDHPRFHEVKDIVIPIYPAKDQLEGKGLSEKSVGDAVKEGIINNETLGYFIARIYLFLIKLGVKREKLRFRQHMANEMAHYACDCWDAEINCSYGWIEPPREKLVVREPLETPIIKDHLVLELNKSKIGPVFRGDAKAVYAYFDGLHEEGGDLQKQLKEGGGKTDVVSEGKTFTITGAMVNIFRRTDKINNITPLFLTVADKLRAVGVSTRVDASSTSIGKRYARNDELGTPFGVTVDFQTIKDGTVTLRERDSMKQIRESIPTIVKVVQDLVEENTTWSEVIAKYPEFSQQEI
ncbi:hypothetical protein BC829DRAFT_414283 [Chytridium lagenaria]|nr:hypothetical protein BC829DRAFT_414283 [Chytridium lagenaria]